MTLRTVLPAHGQDLRLHPSLLGGLGRYTHTVNSLKKPKRQTPFRLPGESFFPPLYFRQVFLHMCT